MNFLCVALVVLAVVAGNRRCMTTQATPGILQGIFTTKSNNPAFKCNKAVLGETYNNVVIEARLRSWDNEDDDTYKGADCEIIPGDSCDMHVEMYIDTEQPQDNWPKGLPMTVVMQEWDANDIYPDNTKYPVGHKRHLYTACKSVPKLSLATIRVALDDLDELRMEKVNNMNCHWAPKTIGTSRQDTPFETINCCTAFERDMKGTVRHELKLDVRAFVDNAGNNACPADGRFNRR